jgi:exodeoxyribonuclease III
MYLRLINWNCRGMFRRKCNSIFEAEPDIAIIQECERGHGLPVQSLWFGDDIDKGIGIFASSDYKLSLHPSYNPDFKYIIPIVVTGKDKFNLLAVWAMDDKSSPEKRCIYRILQALDYYKDLLKEPIVIAGDFNCNIGKSIPILDKHKIRSVYHKMYREKFGKESHPTLYSGDMSQSYYTDYCFASKDLNIEKIGITDPNDWFGLSNHMALIVDFE